ncbi:MAG: methionine adenosyltransferase [Sphingomonas sp.]
MNLQITPTRRDPSRHPFEIVERKGVGHPDTLSDHLAETLSRIYSRYTQSRFGMVLRHQFDKTAIMCGRCRVSFGDGEMKEPIRVLVNGRASSRLGDALIPLRELLTEAVKGFFSERFPMLDPERDIRILYEVRDGLYSSTSGVFGDEAANAAAIHYRFHPRSLADLPESSRVVSNDTSLGCASAPYTPLEQLVLSIEDRLQALNLEESEPWVGTDIKTMAVRHGSDLSLVVAAPVLARAARSADEYFARVRVMEGIVRNLTSEVMPHNHLSRLMINCSDDIEERKLYMNFTGSSIESGDEGMVGRGNRMGGVIAPLRPWTMEGICGKNSVYHVGKLYSVAAFEIAHRLERKGLPASVYLINRMAAPLTEPWFAHVEVDPGCVFEAQSVEQEVGDVMNDLPSITEGILLQRYRLA